VNIQAPVFVTLQPAAEQQTRTEDFQRTASVMKLKVVYKFNGPLSSFPRKHVLSKAEGRESSWGLATFLSSKKLPVPFPALDSGSPQPEADLAGMTLGLFNEL
jgi:hypothetical protein